MKLSCPSELSLLNFSSIPNKYDTRAKEPKVSSLKKSRIGFSVVGWRSIAQVDMINLNQLFSPNHIKEFLMVGVK